MKKKILSFPQWLNTKFIAIKTNLDIADMTISSNIRTYKFLNNKSTVHSSRRNFNKIQDLQESKVKYPQEQLHLCKRISYH